MKTPNRREKGNTVLSTLNTSIRKKRQDQGFTLIELLVVILIIGILAAIVVVAVRGTTGDASSKACSQNAANLASAIDRYLADNNDQIADPSPAGAAITAPVNAVTGTYTGYTTYTKTQLEGLLVPKYIKSVPESDKTKTDFAVVAVKAATAGDPVYGVLCEGTGGTNSGL